MAILSNWNVSEPDFRRVENERSGGAATLPRKIASVRVHRRETKKMTNLPSLTCFPTSSPVFSDRKFTFLRAHADVRAYTITVERNSQCPTVRKSSGSKIPRHCPVYWFPTAIFAV